jgi:hypothetical protein
MIPYAQIAKYSQIKEIPFSDSKEKTETDQAKKCKNLCEFSHIYKKGMSNLHDCYLKCKKNN